MRRLSLTLTMLAAAAALLASGARRTQAEPPPKPVELAGVTWDSSFQRAKTRAQREGKPVLLLHLLGRFDEEFC